MNTISVFNTYISPDAHLYVSKVLESTFLSEGKLVNEFEHQLSKELGLVNPVTVNSGSSALHLALVLAGIKPGDEVICPAQTFVASALVILQERAVPVFADIQYETGNIEPASIESKITAKTKAIMPVHWGGYPCDMDEITAIAKKHNLTVIEDAAHSLGATYKGRPIGTISDFTCFSFQAIKHLTTGDGGAICCPDNTLAHNAVVRRWFGIDRANSQQSILGERDYNIDIVGYKYHLNDYAAALGLANLVDFSKRLHRRRDIADIYRKEFAAVQGIKLFDVEPDREHAYWLFGMHVECRDEFIRSLLSRGISASVVHQRIDRNTVFGGKRNDLFMQAKFDETQIHLPLHDGLSDEDVTYIVESVKQGW